jgi:hypothetical protein
MKYIALLYREPDAGPSPGTPEFLEMLGEFESATAAMADAGVLVDSSPLQPPQTATTVRVRNGETQLSDGPFADSELLRFDPSPVIEANRAVAVAYAEGPAAGLAILYTLSASSRLARWPQLHIARAALLAQCGRREDAAAAYRDALALEPAEPVRRHITGQIVALGAAHAPTEET